MSSLEYFTEEVHNILWNLQLIIIKVNTGELYVCGYKTSKKKRWADGAIS